LIKKNVIPKTVHLLSAIEEAAAAVKDLFVLSLAPSTNELFIYCSFGSPRKLNLLAFGHLTNLHLI